MNIQVKVYASRKNRNSQEEKIIPGSGECCERNKPETTVSGEARVCCDNAPPQTSVADSSRGSLPSFATCGKSMTRHHCPWSVASVALSQLSGTEPEHSG